MSEKKPTWRHKLAAALFSTALTIGVIALFGHFIKIGNKSLNQVLLYNVWQMKNKIVGTGGMSIMQEDAVLGWSQKPSDHCKHYKPFGFNVTYTTDDHGNRVTPGGYDKPKILVLGCSFGFGHGVQDNEHFPAILGQNIPEYKVINGAVMGYGTIQAYLKLKQMLEQPNDIKMVVYEFIPHHLHRNYLRKYWLELLWQSKRRNPHFEMNNGQLQLVGLADVEKDGLTDTTLLNAKELELTRGFVAEMRHLCEKDSIPFLLTYIPDGTVGYSDKFLDVLDPTQVLDLRPVLDFSKIDNGVDAHPNAEGHRQIANALLPVIRKKLGLSQ